MKNICLVGQQGLKEGCRKIMAKFTCPHCYEMYGKNLIKYCCPDCNTIVLAPSKEPIKCISSGCGGVATIRLCPMCMVDNGMRNGINEIPRIALETPNLSFSIVGVSTSGKTNYITIMLDELMKFSDIRLAMGDQTNETRDHQKYNIQEIKHGRAPAGTVSGNPIPQIWYIKNLMKKRKGLFGDQTVPTYTFTIYDGAGEDHMTMDPTMVRYIKSSEAFIIVLDPLVLEGVRSFVDPQVMKNSLKGDQGVSENSTEVVERLVNMLTNIKGLKIGTMLKMPVAVVLTKFDTVINHPAFANTKVKHPSLSIENGKVRTEEFEQIHNEIENWLKNIGEQRFINALDSSFAKLDRKGNHSQRHYNFFAVSSYGEPPQEEGAVAKKITPHRVLDPILWLFAKNKFID